MGKNDNNNNNSKNNSKNNNSNSTPYLNNDTQTLSKFNSLIVQAQNILNNKSTSESSKQNNLKQKYLEATHNYLTGPEQIENAFKNYYVYEKGELAYNEEYESVLEKRTAVIISQFMQNFRENISNSKILLESYTSLFLNYQNVNDYYNTINKKNADLKKKLITMKADTLTNDRKTYYEDQGINSLISYSNIIFFIYIATIIGFVVCMIIKPSNVPKIMQIVILIFLILYIFIAVPFFTFIISILKKIGSMLPKNVYTSL